MARIFKVVLASYLRVIIDLSALEDIYGSRSDQYAEKLAERIKEECFRGEAEIRFTPSYVAVEAKRIPELYGFIQRCVENIEHKILATRGLTSHIIALYRSKNSLQPFDYTSYQLITEVPESIKYRAVALSADTLRRGGYECTPYGSTIVCYFEEVFPPTELRAETVFGETIFKIRDRGKAVFSERKGRDIARRFFNSAIREKLRNAGFIVYGQSIFEKRNVFKSEDIVVKPGFRYTSRVDESGYIYLYISPKFSIESPPLYDFKEDLVGSLARTVDTGLTGRIKGFEGNNFLVDIQGVTCRVKPGYLTLIYSMDELQRIGLSRDLLSTMRLGPKKLLDYSNKYIRAVSGVEVTGTVVEFEDNPLSVEE